MKTLYSILILLSLIPFTHSQTLPQQLNKKIALQTGWTDGIYKINYNGYNFIIDITNKELKSLRSPLFNDSLKKNINNQALNYIEEAFADYLLELNSPQFNDCLFEKGTWDIVKAFQNNASFKLLNNNSRTYIATWQKKDTIAVLTFPISYDRVNKGTRGEIENRYIDGLKKFSSKEVRTPPQYNVTDLKKIGDNIYEHSGEIYTINKVNKNSYFTINEKGQAQLIMESKNPIPTIANMILIGNGFEGTLELKISKHEYGESEIINIPLEKFIQYNIANGCDIFWGLDSFNSNILKGTIFCYNSNEGYDHIIRIEVKTSLLGSNKLVIKGYASLFVPTNNIQNLFQDKNEKNKN